MKVTARHEFPGSTRPPPQPQGRGGMWAGEFGSWELKEIWQGPPFPFQERLELLKKLFIYWGLLFAPGNLLGFTVVSWHNPAWPRFSVWGSQRQRDLPPGCKSSSESCPASLQLQGGLKGPSGSHGLVPPPGTKCLRIWLLYWGHTPWWWVHLCHIWVLPWVLKNNNRQTSQLCSR